MPPISPFDLPGIWLKANLHCHSRESDGALTPAQVLEEHRRAGYDAFALTDHDRVTRLEGNSDGPLVLRGAEITLGRTRQGSPIHCVAIGLTAEELPPTFASPAWAFDWVWEQGAFPVLAHPHWSGFGSEELAALAGVRAIEIYNHGCSQENHKGLGVVYWDELLSHGRTVWGVAADDAHWREPDFGGGWVHVRVPGRSPSDLVTALRAGHFYSSCGPEIQSLHLSHNRLYVRTSPAAAIYWIGPGRLGWSRHAAAGERIQEAEFVLKGHPAWVRVEVVDADGRWAWINPQPVGAEAD